MGQYIEYFYEHNKSIPYFSGDKNIKREPSFFYSIIEETIFSSSPGVIKVLKHAAINDQVGAYFFSKQDFLENFSITYDQNQTLSFLTEEQQRLNLYTCDIPGLGGGGQPPNPPIPNDPQYPSIPEYLCGPATYVHSMRCVLVRACEKTLNITYHCAILLGEEYQLIQEGFGYDGENLRTQLKLTTNAPDGARRRIIVKAIVNPGPMQTDFVVLDQTVTINNGQATVRLPLPPNGAKIVMSGNEYNVNFIAGVVGTNVSINLNRPNVNVNYELVENKLKVVASINGMSANDFDNYLVEFKHRYDAPSGSMEFPYNSNDLVLRNYDVVDLPIQHDVGGTMWVYSFEARYNMYQRDFIYRTQRELNIEYEIVFVEVRPLKFLLGQDQFHFDDIRFDVRANNPGVFVFDKNTMMVFKGPVYASFFNQTTFNESSNFICLDYFYGPCSSPPNNLSFGAYSAPVNNSTTNYGIKVRYNGRRAVYEDDDAVRLEDLCFKLCHYQIIGPDYFNLRYSFAKKVIGTNNVTFIPIAFANLYITDFLKCYKYDKKNITKIFYSFVDYNSIYLKLENIEFILALLSPSLEKTLILCPSSLPIPSDPTAYDNLVIQLYNDFVDFINNEKIHCGVHPLIFLELSNFIEINANLLSPPLTNSNFNSMFNLPNGLGILNLAFFLREESPGSMDSMAGFSYNGNSKGVSSILDLNNNTIELDFYIDENVISIKPTTNGNAIEASSSQNLFSSLSAYASYQYGSYNIFDYAGMPYVNYTDANNNTYKTRPFLVSTDISENLPPNFTPAFEVLGYTNEQEARQRFNDYVNALLGNSYEIIISTYATVLYGDFKSYYFFS